MINRIDGTRPSYIKRARREFNVSFEAARLFFLRLIIYFRKPLPAVYIALLTNRGSARQSALAATETMSGQAFVEDEEGEEERKKERKRATS